MKHRKSTDTPAAEWVSIVDLATAVQEPMARLLELVDELRSSQYREVPMFTNPPAGKKPQITCEAAQSLIDGRQLTIRPYIVTTRGQRSAQPIKEFLETHGLHAPKGTFTARAAERHAAAMETVHRR